MKIARTLRTRYILGATLLVLSGWLTALPAQAQDNGVYNASNTVVGSPAFIDASTFSGVDICQKINNALTTGSLPAGGGVVDARGIVPSGDPAPPQPCVSNPFNNVTVPSTVLLPVSTITMSYPWVLPDHTHLIGQGRQTTLSVSSSFQPHTVGNAMVEMGYYGILSGTYAPCPFPPNQYVCTGVSVESLALDSSGYTVAALNGIYNGNSQDLSYVDEVALNPIGLTGILVAAQSGSASGASNSGPYSRINYTPPASSTCPSNGCPICVDIETQTRGLHGITCTGALDVSGTPGHAAIYVNAGNNTVEDVHLEGYYDGIEVGNIGPPAPPVGNVVISNVTSGTNQSHGGPVTNTVHICGAYNNQNITNGNPDPCNVTNGSVSDVSILDVTGNSNGCTMVIQDDVTGTSIGPDTPVYDLSSAVSVGMYVLGEEVVANGTTGVASGYSRFSTNPSVAYLEGSSQCGSNPVVETSTVPTWGVGKTQASGACGLSGGNPPGTPGAIYSDTLGGTSGHQYSVFVCSGNPPAWQGVI